MVFFSIFLHFGTKHKAHIGGCRSTPLCNRQKFGDIVAFLVHFFARPIFGTSYISGGVILRFFAAALVRLAAVRRAKALPKKLTRLAAVRCSVRPYKCGATEAPKGRQG